MTPRYDNGDTPIMTIRDVARYLKVHQSTLYKLIRLGQIPVFRIGTEYRFNHEAIEKWIAQRSAPPRSRPASDRPG